MCECVSDRTDGGSGPSRQKFASGKCALSRRTVSHMRIELIIPIFRLYTISRRSGPGPARCIIRHNHARPTTERESSAARLASHRAAVRRALDLPQGPPEGVTVGATTLPSHFEPLGLTGLGIPRA